MVVETPKVDFYNKSRQCLEEYSSSHCTYTLFLFRTLIFYFNGKSASPPLHGLCRLLKVSGHISGKVELDLLCFLLL